MFPPPPDAIMYRISVPPETNTLQNHAPQAGTVWPSGLACSRIPQKLEVLTRPLVVSDRPEPPVFPVGAHAGPLPTLIRVRHRRPLTTNPAQTRDCQVRADDQTSDGDARLSRLVEPSLEILSAVKKAEERVQPLHDCTWAGLTRFSIRSLEPAAAADAAIGTCVKTSCILVHALGLLNSVVTATATPLSPLVSCAAVWA